MTSDKAGLLARRKLELEHAINNEFPPDKIVRAAERVRDAALALLKKRYVADEIDSSWGCVEERWLDMTHDEVIAAAVHWPDNPTTRDLRRSL